MANQIKCFTHDEKDSNTISSNSPVSLALQDDKLWIATYDGGINCYDIKLEKFKRFPVNTQYELSCRNIYVDKSDRVWVIDITGLKVYDAENDLFSGYYPVENNPYSIKRLCVGIFQDCQGNYWTMHSGNGIGLSTVSKGLSFFDNLPESYWHITSDNVSSIGEEENGNLWIGNPSNGIDVFNWSKGSSQKFTNNPLDKYSIGAGATPLKTNYFQ